MVQMSTEELLRSAREGDKRAEARLIEHLYQDLKRMAAYHLAGERRNHTLQPTALVNEAYRRLAASAGLQASDRGHLFALMGTTMRRVLVDCARARKTSPNGNLRQARPGELEEVFQFDPRRPKRYLALDHALEMLAARDPKLVALVEMRFFAGLTEEQAAEALGVSRRTVVRWWLVSKAVLQEEMLSA